MYVNENPEYEEETAMLIEEMLRQRIKGMQNEVGAWITPAFPKLLYVTDENNIKEGTKYWYLTKLAAQCVTKRMMPDFLSAKILKENYGDVFNDVIISSDINAYKPDKKFYDILIKRAGVKPSEILFLDDRLENVEAARMCEIKSEQVKGYNVLEIIDEYMGDKNERNYIQ